MAKGKALNEKPHAGNPHVRFDEGEVASAATPRRGSLLCKNKAFLPLACLVAILAGCDGTPNDGMADFAKGKAAYDARDLKTAVKHLTASVQVCATNFDAHVTLALANLALGDVEAADRAIKAARTVLPDSAEALLVDAEVGWLAKDFARAKSGYSAVANAKQLPNDMRSQAYSSRAVVELAENEFDQARVSLWRAMRLNPRNPSAWYHLGVLSRDTWKFDDAALQQFTIASNFLDPSGARLRDVLRNVIPALRDATARSAAAKPGVTARNPGAAAKLIGEGDELVSKKQTMKALKKFAAAYEADRLSFPAAFNYAKLLASTEKTSAGVDKTLAVFAAALDAKPISQEAGLAAARYAMYNKRWATAVKILNRSLAYYPDSKQMLRLYVDALQKTGDSKTAALYQSWFKEL